VDALFVQDQDGENGICFPCPSKMVLLGLMVECNNIMLEVEGYGDGIYGSRGDGAPWTKTMSAAVGGGWTVEGRSAMAKDKRFCGSNGPDNGRKTGASMALSAIDGEKCGDEKDVEKAGCKNA